MTVIKSNQTSGMLREAVVLDLGDIARQAARIEAAAQTKAAQIEKVARDRAAKLIENAGAEGFEQGKEAGFEAGVVEGRSQGRGDALKEAQAELERLQSTWAETCAKLESHLQLVEREARQSVLELALRLAEKIVHRTVQVDDSVVVDQVTGALAHALGDYEVSVRISPQDRPTLDAALPKLLDEFGRFQSVKLVEDENIRRGGCELTFGQGQVDASLDTQLRRVVELLMPEPEADQPSPQTQEAVDVVTETPDESVAEADPDADVGPSEAVDTPNRQ